MSNAIVVTAIKRSDAESPGRLRIDARKFTSARCGTATPFGRPVEPDANRTYAGDSGDVVATSGSSTATTGDAVDGAAVTGCFTASSRRLRSTDDTAAAEGATVDVSLARASRASKASSTVTTRAPVNEAKRGSCCVSVRSTAGRASSSSIPIRAGGYSGSIGT